MTITKIKNKITIKSQEKEIKNDEKMTKESTNIDKEFLFSKNCIFKVYKKRKTEV